MDEEIPGLLTGQVHLWDSPELCSVRAAVKTAKLPISEESLNTRATQQDDSPGRKVSQGGTAQASQDQESGQLHLRHFHPEIALGFGQVLQRGADGLFACIVVTGNGLSAGLPTLDLPAVNLEFGAC